MSWAQKFGDFCGDFFQESEPEYSNFLVGAW